MALHSGLTDPNLHEPKGVSTASSGTVYVANGSGSGSWTTRLPSMSGKSGYLLTTDGTNESWSNASSVRARGSVSVSGTTPTLETGSVNVASVTRVAGPLYKITFTTTLSSANYQAFASVRGAPIHTYPIVGSYETKTTSYCNFQFAIHGTASAIDPLSFDFLIFGGF